MFDIILWCSIGLIVGFIVSHTIRRKQMANMSRPVVVVEDDDNEKKKLKKKVAELKDLLSSEHEICKRLKKENIALNEQIKAQNEKIEFLEQSRDDLQINIDKLKVSFHDVESANNKLHCEMKGLQDRFSVQLQEQVNTIHDLERKVKAFEEKEKAALKSVVNVAETTTGLIENIEKLDAEPVEKIEALIVESTETIEKVSSEQDENAWLGSFVIPKSENYIFLPNDYEVILKNLEKVKSVSDFVEYVQNSGISTEKQERQIKTFTRYENDVQKLIDKLVKLDNYDAEELSEIYTEKFFKIVQNRLLVMLTNIYRSGEDTREFYSGLLKILNKHLTACGCYSIMVIPGTKYTDDLLDYMDPSPIPVNDINLHGMIREVENLPYFMEYEDEDGNILKFIRAGKMYVNKYEKG